MPNKILVGHHGWSAPRQTSPANKKEFYPWHIWVAKNSDSSGNTSAYWMCAEQWRSYTSGETSADVTHAGSVINSDHIYTEIDGTPWTYISGSTYVYLNVTKNDLNSISGKVETSACAISLSGNPITYPVKLANLYYYSSGNVTIEQ